MMAFKTRYLFLLIGAMLLLYTELAQLYDSLAANHQETTHVRIERTAP